MPDVRLVGSVADIDGVEVSVCTEGQRIRLEVGSSVAVLGQLETEEFAQLLVSAAWEVTPGP